MGVFSKHLAALIGIAFIFGFTSEGATAAMVVKRSLDATSPTFLLDEFSGTNLGAVTLHCILYNETLLPVATLAFKMTDCQIVSINEQGSSNSPEEEITFGFSKITLQYTKQ